MLSSDRVYEKQTYEPHIASNLRRDLRKEKEKREEAEAKYYHIKRNTTQTKVLELEIELKNYVEECKRLTTIINEEYGSQKSENIVTECQQKNTAIEEKLKAKCSEISTLQAEIIRKNTEIKSITNKLNEKSVETESLINENNKKLSQLQNKYTNTEKEITQIKKNNETIIEEANSAKAKTKQIQEEYENYRSTTEAQLKNAYSQLERYKEKIKENIEPTGKEPQKRIEESHKTSNTDVSQDLILLIKALKKALKAQNITIEMLLQEEQAINNSVNVISKEVLHNKLNEIYASDELHDLLIPYSYGEGEYKYDDIINLFKPHFNLEVSQPLLKAFRMYINECKDQNKGYLEDLLAHARMSSEQIGDKIKVLQVFDKSVLINKFKELSIPEVNIDILLNSTKEVVIVKRLTRVLELAETATSYSIENITNKIIAQKSKRLFEHILDNSTNGKTIEAHNLITLLSINTSLPISEIEYFVSHYSSETTTTIDLSRVFTDLQFNQQEFELKHYPNAHTYDMNAVINHIKSQNIKDLIKNIASNSQQGIIPAEKLKLLLSFSININHQEIDYLITQLSDNHQPTGNIDIQTIFKHIQSEEDNINQQKPQEKIPNREPKPEEHYDLNQIIHKLEENKSKQLIKAITEKTHEGKIATSELLSILSSNTNLAHHELEYYAKNAFDDAQLADVNTIWKHIRHTVEQIEEELPEEIEPHQITEESNCIIRYKAN